MLIDTHCHLDAFEFDADRAGVIERARAAGVGTIVLPAVDRAGFGRVRAVCAGQPDLPRLRFALGIHPLCVPAARHSDIDALALELDDPEVIAVGEIGLDFFVADIDPALQENYFVRQLELARDFGLPVLLHVRRSQDRILKHLRAVFGRTGPGGIAHAFNGSRQQADEFIKLGFALGFGGAVTWARALNLRRLVTELPLDALVLETDSPDIAPEFAAGQRNEPANLPRIAQVIAGIRGVSEEELTEATGANALRVLPRLAAPVYSA
ncbi:TatD family hydrolase [Methyloversatilis sp.]|uniref:TatD family hydrolase n=1 Tax=Methyloversatilis sp. TaxID=2569862 RepID=UPI0027323847|nr:TatD family hydrolase [Methyloversatilis sp.]MDP2867882.1 TatD family hydrolase [Methyloversatilis sp.]MDP3287161.1 TatD family hydrolase [Methyloversatilis sp.]MDP3454443.1 TatD family hydrolase [Methyloversatilis sp.]MDP3577593.1 TatD family hydrolase [Methyloversatilis sp.]